MATLHLIALVLMFAVQHVVCAAISAPVTGRSTSRAAARSKSMWSTEKHVEKPRSVVHPMDPSSVLDPLFSVDDGVRHRHDNPRLKQLFLNDRLRSTRLRGYSHVWLFAALVVLVVPLTIHRHWHSQNDGAMAPPPPVPWTSLEKGLEAHYLLKIGRQAQMRYECQDTEAPQDPAPAAAPAPSPMLAPPPKLPPALAPASAPRLAVAHAPALALAPAPALVPGGAAVLDEASAAVQVAAAEASEAPKDKAIVTSHAEAYAILAALDDHEEVFMDALARRLGCTLQHIPQVKRRHRAAFTQVFSKVLKYDVSKGCRDFIIGRVQDPISQRPTAPPPPPSDESTALMMSELVARLSKPPMSQPPMTTPRELVLQ